VQPWARPVAPSFMAISAIFLAIKGRERLVLMGYLPSYKALAFIAGKM
jgi:hypothetical protein